MAAAGTRAQKPVGSAAWIAAEKENMMELVDQEIEEVEYPVRHEMEWLNEHMAEIFSKGQVNLTDVFKTPGKMRGKTPRTARKRIPEENRLPLSEIFSSAHKQLENRVSPSPFIHRVVSKPATMMASSVPRKDVPENTSQPDYPNLSQNLNSFPKYNTDSGYHGMVEDDEMVLPNVQPESQTSTQPVEEAIEPPTQERDMSVGPQPTEDSFHSAQENVRSRGETVEPINVDPTPTQQKTRSPEPRDPDLDSNATPTLKTYSKSKVNAVLENQQQQSPVQKNSKQKEAKMVSSPENPSAMQSVATPGIQQQDDQVEEDGDANDDTVLDNLDDIGSPSDGSTPERPLVRKSSLTFASLPAREPLGKSLVGPRISRTSHVDLAKLNTAGPSGYFGRQTGGHRMTQAATEDNVSSGHMEIEDEKEAEGDDDTVKVSQLHNKKSTQTLHERISMLGKLQPSRSKKSISAMPGISGGQVSYPDLPASKAEAKSESSSQKAHETPAPEPVADEEDDWIKPLSSPQRPGITKSKTTDVMEKLFDVEKQQLTGQKAGVPSNTEANRPKSATSIFSSPRQAGNLQSTSAETSTTPGGSPRRFDGPLSASKMRLQSIMKSAKGLFTSTGAVSSSARFESSSPLQTRSQLQERPGTDVGGVDEHESQAPHASSPSRQEGRRTRGSIEKAEKQRQKELEERQLEEARQEKAREREKQRVIQLKAVQDKSSIEPEDRTAPITGKAQVQRQQSREPESVHEVASKSVSQPKNERRPVRPTREAVQKPKPQPVSIRVGSTLSRMPLPSVSSGVQDSNPPAPAPAPAQKQATLKKKGSNSSLHTVSSTGSFKSSVSSQTQAQRKAQLANERKKEQDERRKEEQKREQERKRTAQQQQEEARRQEMRSRAEAERERRERSAQEDPQKAAHMQAIEKRRQENARKHERQGSQQSVNEGPMLQHEKAGQQTSQRNDMGANRPPSRLGYGRAINPPVPNPAKPPKRVMDEETNHRPAVSKPSNAHSTSDAKRRKTDDENNTMQPVRAPMAPPIRKEPGKPSFYGHGQASMAHPSGSSVFKNAQPQRPAHPMDMAKITSGKIPFADPNHAPPPAAYKPSAAGSQRAPPAKPSPKYPNSDSVHLPEIATDSEDEDDSDSEMFPVPQWAQAKELEGLLRQQDGMEVDSIFGPIAPFSLEETFKADKKIKKYRDRTSSANWSGPDGLTQDEIRRDRADRQRLRLNGGWSFNT
ncbi:uncharacterized protein PFLUO_LOCUS8573 [Penicillium psychrofluorescens]|uniref:uncharacterized protein n=1 Tax=Penicillium psychrofluorescens TaxID=3158075 RepID=UPI003CCE07B2